MKNQKKWVSLSMTLGLLLGMAVFPAKAVESQAVPMNSAAFAAQLDRLGSAEEGLTLVVQTKSNAPLTNDFGAKTKAEGFNNWHILRYASKASADAALEQFRRLPEVERANPSKRISLIAPVVNESTAAGAKAEPMSWGAPMVGSPEMKAALAGQSLPTVRVAILDTGLDFDHPYFKQYSGRVERLLGKYYYSKDDNGHGTHVAGIILDNSPGNVKIVPYKVLDSWGSGYDYDIAIAMCTAVDDGADVLSMSLGGWGYDGDILSSAVRYAVYQGTSVVVAAGNDYGDDAKYYSPACAPAAITVAAINKDATPAYFTNQGDVVDIAAPGGYADRGDRDNSINSTTPQFTGALYQRWAGTSMACPFVSAAAATVKSLHPEYTPEDIERALKATAGAPKNWDAKYGDGVLNCRALLELPDKPMTNIKLAAGETRQLALPEGFTPTRWKSGNPSAASVQDGLLTAEKRGTTLVTAYGEEDNVYYNVTVTWNWWQWILVIVAFGWAWL
jgi:subtilisin family serine protease